MGENMSQDGAGVAEIELVTRGVSEVKLATPVVREIPEPIGRESGRNLWALGKEALEQELARNGGESLYKYGASAEKIRRQLGDYRKFHGTELKRPNLSTENLFWLGDQKYGDKDHKTPAAKGLKRSQEIAWQILYRDQIDFPIFCKDETKKNILLAKHIYKSIKPESSKKAAKDLVDADYEVLINHNVMQIAILRDDSESFRTLINKAESAFGDEFDKIVNDQLLELLATCGNSNMFKLVTDKLKNKDIITSYRDQKGRNLLQIAALNGNLAGIVSLEPFLISASVEESTPSLMHYAIEGYIEKINECEKHRNYLNSGITGSGAEISTAIASELGQLTAVITDAASAAMTIVSGAADMASFAAPGKASGAIDKISDVTGKISDNLHAAATKIGQASDKDVMLHKLTALSKTELEQKFKKINDQYLASIMALRCFEIDPGRIADNVDSPTPLPLHHLMQCKSKEILPVLKLLLQREVQKRVRKGEVLVLDKDDIARVRKAGQLQDGDRKAKLQGIGAIVIEERAANVNAIHNGKTVLQHGLANGVDHEVIKALVKHEPRIKVEELYLQGPLGGAIRDIRQQTHKLLTVVATNIQTTGEAAKATVVQEVKQMQKDAEQILHTAREKLAQDIQAGQEIIDSAKKKAHEIVEQISGEAALAKAKLAQELQAMREEAALAEKVAKEKLAQELAAMQEEAALAEKVAKEELAKMREEANRAKKVLEQEIAKMQEEAALAAKAAKEKLAQELHEMREEAKRAKEFLEQEIAKRREETEAAGEMVKGVVEKGAEDARAVVDVSRQQVGEVEGDMELAREYLKTTAKAVRSAVGGRVHKLGEWLHLTTDAATMASATPLTRQELERRERSSSQERKPAV